MKRPFVKCFVLMLCFCVTTIMGGCFPNNYNSGATQEQPNPGDESGIQTEIKEDVQLSTKETTGIWYQDNNVFGAGTVPADFKERFYKPETWAKSREVMDVLMMRSNALISNKIENGLDDDFLQNVFIPLLNESNIEIALNALGAGHTEAKGKEDVVYQEVELVRKLRNMGGKVNYISLQSVLSKPLRMQGQKVNDPKADTSTEARVKNIVRYVKIMKDNFPDIQVGFVDASPNKGYEWKEPYQLLASALRENKLTLDFIIMDCPYETPQEGINFTWQDVKQVEAFVKNEIKAEFGFIATSKTGKESAKSWHTRTLDVPNQMNKAGAHPDWYVVTSWFEYPKESIPEDAGDGKYPVLKTVLAFYEELKKHGYYN